MMPDFVFSSESTTEGHPDKLCDQVSDALVDAYLRQDPLARIHAECAVSTGIVFVSVKHAARATVDVPSTAREVIRAIGYRSPGFDALDSTVMTALHDLGEPERIDEAALGEDRLDAIVAADQATVFGFACRDTSGLMPLPIWLAHRLTRQLDEVRRTSEGGGLEPDGKVQVGVEFRDLRPHRIHTVTVITSQGKKDRPTEAELEALIRDRVLGPAFADEAIRPDDRTRVAVNPEGPLVPGGPVTHAGLTGRKAGVDTYGEFARQSGSALSGKDPSRVDRIGAYVARHAARCAVAARLAERCEVTLTYAVGLSRPVSVGVETFGTGRIPEPELVRRLERVFDFRPAAVLRRYRLRELPARRPEGFFRKLAVYGQVGRTDLELPWESEAEAAALAS